MTDDQQPGRGATRTRSSRARRALAGPSSSPASATFTPPPLGSARDQRSPGRPRHRSHPPTQRHSQPAATTFHLHREHRKPGPVAGPFTGHADPHLRPARQDPTPASARCPTPTVRPQNTPAGQGALQQAAPKRRTLKHGQTTARHPATSPTTNTQTTAPASGTRLGPDRMPSTVPPRHHQPGRVYRRRPQLPQPITHTLSTANSPPPAAGGEAESSSHADERALAPMRRPGILTAWTKTSRPCWRASTEFSRRIPSSGT
ncbi:Uncharacterised protein [Mycobacterium tuberculosis]|nr:Uncharacterised protein [Mycobacterium tuberculosis]